MTLFGAAYYPEYMPSEYDTEERIKTDLSMMKKAGMNVIRIAESTWSVLEPEKDKFNFFYIDKTLEIAESMDMKVIVGTPTYAIPSWLCKEDPSVMAVWQKGQANYGGRQQYDLSNKTYIARCEIVIRKLMEHVAKSPVVIGYQIDNETKHYGSYSESMQALFVDYLKDKFKTPEALNKAFYLNYWSNSVASWEDFPDMKGCCNGGLEAEYQLFLRNYAAQFLHWEIEIVKEYARPGQFITHNFDYSWKKVGNDPCPAGYSYCIQDDIAQTKAAEKMTLIGTDIYHPTGCHLTGAEQSMGGDIMRNLKGDGRNYVLLETEAQAFKYFTTFPGQLLLHAVTNFANGAAGQLYWHWHSIHNGFETYWKGVLDHSLTEGVTYRDAAEIGKLLSAHGEEITIRKKPQVLVISDVHSKKAFNYFPMDNDLTYDDVFRWIYDELYKMNIETDIVDYTVITAEKLSEYKAVIVPALYSTDKAFDEILSDYVKNGGKLIATFASFKANRCLSVYDTVAPAYLTDCFGIETRRDIYPEDVTVGGKKARYVAELIDTKDARALYNYENKYWKAYAAVTENSYGEGRAVYIGAYVNRKILKNILNYTLCDLRQNILVKASFPCIVKAGVNADGENIVFILNFSGDEIRTSELKIDATDILTGSYIAKGDRITLPGWGFAILKKSERQINV